MTFGGWLVQEIGSKIKNMKKNIIMLFQMNKG